jgi:hypothetical protein
MGDPLRPGFGPLYLPTDFLKVSFTCYYRSVSVGSKSPSSRYHSTYSRLAGDVKARALAKQELSLDGLSLVVEAMIRTYRALKTEHALQNRLLN